MEASAYKLKKFLCNIQDVQSPELGYFWSQIWLLLPVAMQDEAWNNSDLADIITKDANLRPYALELLSTNWVNFGKLTDVVTIDNMHRLHPQKWYQLIDVVLSRAFKSIDSVSKWLEALPNLNNALL